MIYGKKLIILVNKNKGGRNAPTTAERQGE